MCNGNKKPIGHKGEDCDFIHCCIQIEHAITEKTHSGLLREESSVEGDEDVDDVQEEENDAWNRIGSSFYGSVYDRYYRYFNKLRIWEFEKSPSKEGFSKIQKQFNDAMDYLTPYDQKTCLQVYYVNLITEIVIDEEFISAKNKKV